MNGIVIDILMLIIFAVGLYRAWSGKLFLEIFKMFGVLLSTFVTLHYYIALGDLLGAKAFLSSEVSELLAYVALAVVVYVLFNLISEAWIIVLKVEIPREIDQWGSAVVSAVRLYFFCGLVFFGFVASHQPFLTKGANSALTQCFFKRVSVGTYKNLYALFVAPYFKGEEPNKKVLDLIDAGNES